MVSFSQACLLSPFCFLWGELLLPGNSSEDKAMTQAGPYHSEHNREIGSRSGTGGSPPRSFLLKVGRKTIGIHFRFQDASMCLGLPKVVFPRIGRQAICNRKE